MRDGVLATLSLFLSLCLAPAARAQQLVDRIVARVGTDVITLSELDELARFQQLVDGKQQPAAERVRELAEQWMIGHDASLSGFRAPAAADVEKAFAALEKRFASPTAFHQRLKQLGLSENQVRRLLERQIFLTRYLDFRFRAEVQVTDKQIEEYYRNTLLPELKRSGQSAPPLEAVADKVREVLIEQGISRRAAAWLDDLRARWKVDLIGGAP